VVLAEVAADNQLIQLFLLANLEDQEEVWGKYLQVLVPQLDLVHRLKDFLAAQADQVHRVQAVELAALDLLELPLARPAEQEYLGLIKVLPMLVVADGVVLATVL